MNHYLRPLHGFFTHKSVTDKQTDNQTDKQTNTHPTFSISKRKIFKSENLSWDFWKVEKSIKKKKNRHEGMLEKISDRNLTFFSFFFTKNFQKSFFSLRGIWKTKYLINLETVQQFFFMRGIWKKYLRNLENFQQLFFFSEGHVKKKRFKKSRKFSTFFFLGACEKKNI